MRGVLEKPSPLGLPAVFPVQTLQRYFMIVAGMIFLATIIVMTCFSLPRVHPAPALMPFLLPCLRSANFFGAQDWTDGMPPMQLRQEPLGRRAAYAALFWLEDIEPFRYPLMPKVTGLYRNDSSIN